MTESRGSARLPTVVIALGVCIRLLHVNADLWEAHSWRQADVAMIAVNFAHGGFDWLHPQINWAGAGAGYVGTEFPLVPLMIAALYTGLGEHLWLARLVSVAFAVPTMVLFWLLVRRWFGARPAVFALFFLAISPLGVYYSRTLMPESAMLCFSIGAVYFFTRWTDRQRVGAYLAALACTSLALLVKLPAAIIGLPMAYAAHRTFGWRFLRRPEIWLLAVTALLPAILWYWHAFDISVSNYPFHMFGEGLWVWDEPSRLVDGPTYLRLGLTALLFLVTPFGFVFALMVVVRERVGILHWWAMAIGIYLVMGIEGFRQHEYYLLPSLPVVAAFAGLGAHRVLDSSRGAITGLALLVVVSALLLVSPRYESPIDRIHYEAGCRAGAVLPDEALLVAWDLGSPVLIYASGQRGWHFPQHAQLKEGRFGAEIGPREEWMPLLDDLRSEGATHLVAPKVPDTLGTPIREVSDAIFLDDMARRFPIFYEDRHAVIFDLRRAAPD